MHNGAFRELGLDTYIYIPLPVPKYPYIRIKEAILGLRALGFKGANITVPYKEAVLPYMDYVSDSARIIGAINTVLIDDASRLCGYNTDSLGFINDLRERQIFTSSMDVLILGAGGSARAIAYGLLDYGVKSLTILNRTKSKADEIAQNMKSKFLNVPITSDILTHEKLHELPHIDLIINCTSLGLNESIDQMPWDKALRFRGDQIVYDLIYNPEETELLKKAQADGALAINGREMLVHQGALAFSLWTGHKPPVEIMRHELEMKKNLPEGDF